MQRPLDSTLAVAITAGCDTVQPKYDGLSVQFSASRGELTTSDFSLRAVAEPVTGLDSTINCTLIGTYVHSTATRYVFDCWLVEEDGTLTDLRGEPYRSRYVAARIMCKMLGPQVTLVVNASIAKAGELWTNLPNIPHAKGLVFRDSKANAYAQVRVARWYQEVPKELV